MSRISAIANNDWGLAILGALKNPALEADLLAQKAAINSAGYDFVQRLIITTMYGIDGPMFFFWTGHEYLSAPFPQVRQALDLCRRLEIPVLACMSDFVPAYSPEYNDLRYGVPQVKINERRDDILASYSDVVLAYEVDNEPYTGGAAYEANEFRNRCYREQADWASSLTFLAMKISGRDFLSTAHIAIGSSSYEFPPLRGTKAITEAWERPGVSDGYIRYTDWALEHPELELIGYNFGASWVPVEGLVWGRGRYRTFWQTEAGLTSEAEVVLSMLEKNPEEPEKPTEAEALRARCGRISGRLLEALQANDPPRLRRQVDREVRRLNSMASGGGTSPSPRS